MCFVLRGFAKEVQREVASVGGDNQKLSDIAHGLIQGVKKTEDALTTKYTAIVGRKIDVLTEERERVGKIRHESL